MPKSENKPSDKEGKHSRDYIILGIVLMVAIIQGVIYIFLLPPWQHYDEPKHFEYAWMLSNYRHVPQKGDYDPDMSRQVVLSMIEHGFYQHIPLKPHYTPDEDVRIMGYQQFDEPPLYYLSVALPLSFFSDQSITNQLYVARFVSLFFYLLTVLAAWGVTREITSPNSVLRWLVPLLVALLPGFADLMTAVNNDVAAVAILSLFMWVAVRMIKRGFSLSGFLLLSVLAVISVFTKGTAMIALALLPLAAALSLARGKWRWYIWGALGFVFVIMVVAAFSWGDAAYWARRTFQAENTRLITSDATVGRYAMQLVYDPSLPPSAEIWLRQPLPEDIGLDLSHQTVTLGAWMWATHPVKVRSLILRTYPGSQMVYRQALIDQTPTFVALEANLEGATRRTFISFQPLDRHVDEQVTVYADGLVLAQGSYPVDEPPIFTDADAKIGIWGGRSFVNLLQNPSAEQGWPRLRSWVDQVGVMLLPDPNLNVLSVTLYTALDQNRGHDYYYTAASRLFRTFWAKFGWGQVPLLGHKPYRVLVGLTIIAFIGLPFLLFQKRRDFPWEVALFFLVSLLAIWGVALIRGSNYVLIPYKMYYPVARYAFPAIIPTMMVLSAGWIALLIYAKKWFKIKRGLIFALPLLIFVLLNIYAIISILHYYGKGF